MEQIIKAFGVDIRLIFLQMLNFGLLLVALWYFLYTPILNILSERQKKIQKGVEDAESAEKALSSADEEKKGILTVAHREAEEIGARAKIHADEKAVDIVAKAKDKAANVLTDAEAKSEDMKIQARKESEAEIAKVAILAAERVLKERPS